MDNENLSFELGASKIGSDTNGWMHAQIRFFACVVESRLRKVGQGEQDLRPGRQCPHLRVKAADYHVGLVIVRVQLQTQVNML